MLKKVKRGNRKGVSIRTKFPSSGGKIPGCALFGNGKG